MNPLTKVATNTISATPIMSAAAVTAVRPGLRAVFSRASRPEVGEDGSHGHSRGRRISRKVASAPPITSTMAAPISPPVLALVPVRMAKMIRSVIAPTHTHPSVSP